jgi:hypothetical protein
MALQEQMAKDLKATKVAKSRPFWLMSKLKKAGQRARRDTGEEEEEEMPVTRKQEQLRNDIDASRPRFSPVQPRGRQRQRDQLFSQSPEKKRMDEIARKRFGDILISHIKDYGNGKCSMVEVVRVIEMGAPLNYKDTYGNTPLMWAVIKRNADMVELLLKGGADVNAQNNSGNTVIMEAARDPHRTAIAGVLIDHGKVKLKHQTNSGFSCLMIAAQNNNVPFMEMLAEKQVVYQLDLNAQDKEGFTAMHHAAFARKLDSMQHLVRFGASVEVGDNKGRLVAHLLPRPEMEGYDEDEASETCRIWLYNYYHTHVQKRGLGQSPWLNSSDYDWCGSLHQTAFRTVGVEQGGDREAATRQAATTNDMLMKVGGKFDKTDNEKYQVSE